MAGEKTEEFDLLKMKVLPPNESPALKRMQARLQDGGGPESKSRLDAVRVLQDEQLQAERLEREAQERRVEEVAKAMGL